MLMNTRDSYGLVARALHWLIAVLVVGNLLGGVVVVWLGPGSLKTFFLSAHKSMGVVILLLMVLRLIWRIYNPLPRNLGRDPLFSYIAHVLHIWFYVLLFLQPLSGILMSQAFGYPVGVFGLFKLPPLVWNSPALGAVFREIHIASGIALGVIIVLHTAAALKHHFVDRDGTLVRMLKGN